MQTALSSVRNYILLGLKLYSVVGWTGPVRERFRQRGYVFKTVRY
jgi:hypothetical protein